MFALCLSLFALAMSLFAFYRVRVLNNLLDESENHNKNLLDVLNRKDFGDWDITNDKKQDLKIPIVGRWYKSDFGMVQVMEDNGISFPYPCVKLDGSWAYVFIFEMDDFKDLK